MINIDKLNVGDAMWLPVDYETKTLLNAEILASDNKFDVEEFEEEISCKRVL